MIIYAWCIRSNLFLIEVFISQPPILVDIGRHLFTLSLNASNWTEVVPIIPNALYYDGDGSYLPNKLEFVWGVDTSDLRGSE